jgi:hypothetical protein
VAVLQNILIDPTIETVQIPETILFVLESKAKNSVNLFINSLGVMGALSYFFSVEKVIYLENCYQKNQVQKEYCKYLNNLEEAVISNSNDGIRYFNNQGISILYSCLINFKNMNIKNTYTSYLSKIHQ